MNWHAEPQELAALARLWEMAQHDNGGARVCARLLLGLYNGPRFQFDLTDLRLLDESYLADALLVIRMDARPAADMHVLLEKHLGQFGMGARFELLAWTWGFKGKCSKEAADHCRQHLKALAARAEAQRAEKGQVLAHLQGHVATLQAEGHQLARGAS